MPGNQSEITYSRRATDAVRDVLESWVERVESGRREVYTPVDDEHLHLESAMQRMEAVENSMKMCEALRDRSDVEVVNCSLDRNLARASMFRKHSPGSGVRDVIEEHNCEISWERGQNFSVSCPSYREFEGIDWVTS